MKNITSTAVFLKDKKVLLEKRKKTEDNYAGFWALPGGHKRKTESSKKTLIREIKEELGVNVKSAKFLGTFRDLDPTSKAVYHHHAFLCEEWNGKIKKTKEQKGIKWIYLSMIKKLKNTRKVDIRILRKAGLI